MGQPVHDLGAQKKAELLAELFARSSPKAKLVGKVDRREKGATTVASALTFEDFRAHADGRERYGAIPFVDDFHVGWACIDLDVLNWGLEPDDPDSLKMVDTIVEDLAGRNIRAVPERSKFKGWHIWIFFDQPVRADAARAVLRPIALAAGARDESDLICPRSDHASNMGNGSWLPMFGADHPPHTHFFEYDADDEEWVVAENQAAILRQLIDEPTPSDAIRTHTDSPAPATSRLYAQVPDDHPCAWILDELKDADVDLGPTQWPNGDKLAFACPLHDSDQMRPRGGSAVFYPSGNGHCSSARCDGRWKSPQEFVALLEYGGERPRGRSRLVALTEEEFMRDEAPSAIVRDLLYEASTHTLNGASKGGKTYFALQLGMCVASGADFLGLRCMQTPVLYVSLELTAGMLRKRMEAIERDTSIPFPTISEQFHVVAHTRQSLAELNLLEPSGKAALRTLIAETGARLVILDTFYRFTPGADPLGRTSRRSVAAKSDLERVWGYVGPDSPCLAADPEAALSHVIAYAENADAMQRDGHSSSTDSLPRHLHSAQNIRAQPGAKETSHPLNISLARGDH